MYVFSLFQVDSSVALSTVTSLYNHHHCPLQNIFTFAVETLCLLNTNRRLPPPPVAGNHHSTFCSYAFDHSGTSYEWNRIEFH